MTEQPSEFHVTVWAFPVIRFLVIFSTNGVHQGVRSYSVKEVAVSTTPSSRYPFSFPINGFVLVQPNCFCTTLRTFLFYRWHHQYLVVCSIAPTSRAGLKDSHKTIDSSVNICRKGKKWKKGEKSFSRIKVRQNTKKTVYSRFQDWEYMYRSYQESSSLQPMNCLAVPWNQQVCLFFLLAINM